MQVSVSELKNHSEDLDIEWNGKKPKGYRKGPRIVGKSAAERVLEDRRIALKSGGGFRAARKQAFADLDKWER